MCCRPATAVLAERQMTDSAYPVAASQIAANPFVAGAAAVVNPAAAAVVVAVGPVVAAGAIVAADVAIAPRRGEWPRVG